MITLQGKHGKYFYHGQNGLIQPAGKFNTVYKGYDSLYRPVLIKQLHQSLSDDETAVERFSNEYNPELRHDKIISAYDYFIQDEKHYIIRKWVDGTDLSKKRYKFKIREAVNIIIQVVDAVAYLHHNNILHLDIQPKNILLGDDGNVYLADLGLARKIPSIKQRQPFNIYYSAPEQILNHFELFNFTTDLYAAGMILFEMVSKSKAHFHNNPEILMNLVLASPIMKPAFISNALFDVILKATSKPRFNLPPTHYSENELSEMIETSQQLRFDNAASFIQALNMLNETDLKKRPWWKPW